MERKTILVNIEKVDNKRIIKAKYLNDGKTFETVFVAKGKDKAYDSFAEFCKTECWFSDSAYHDVYFLHDTKKKKYADDFYMYLGSVDWCCVHSLEFEYSYLSVHLKRKSFKKFKEELMDKKLSDLDNFEKIYYFFINNYTKKMFNDEELDTMQFYIYDNFELIYRNYNDYIIKLKMQIALSRILENDKERFNKIVTYISGHHSEYKNEVDNKFYRFLKDVCYDYTELHDYKDFLSRDVYNEKLSNSKYYSLFLENDNRETIEKIVKSEEMK